MKLWYKKVPGTLEQKRLDSKVLYDCSMLRNMCVPRAGISRHQFQTKWWISD